MGSTTRMSGSETANRCTRLPAAPQIRHHTHRRAAPEITTAFGLLIAATPPFGEQRRHFAFAGRTATITPPAGKSAINRPAPATMRAAIA